MTAMESRACEKEAEEDPAWTTSSLTFSAVASLASVVVMGAVGTVAGGEGRTWCTLSSEPLPFLYLSDVQKGWSGVVGYP